jgi:glutamine synthetase adenylyltransferase
MHSKVTSHESSTQFRSIELKKNTGGLTTIDYYLSYLQLTNKQLVNLCGRDSYSKKLLLEKLVKLIPQIEKIKFNYNYLKEIEFILQNSFEQRKSLIPRDSVKQNLLAKFVKEKDYKTFEQKLFSILKSNITMFNSIADN